MIVVANQNQGTVDKSVDWKFENWQVTGELRLGRTPVVER